MPVFNINYTDTFSGSLCSATFKARSPEWALAAVNSSLVVRNESGNSVSGYDIKECSVEHLLNRINREQGLRAHHLLDLVQHARKSSVISECPAPWESSKLH